jgi:tape measure domain-containing protein
MADFELLSTYISIRTRGLRQVLRDFATARVAAQRLQQTPIHASVQRASNAASRFRDFMASSQISMTRLARSTRPLAAQFQALDRIQGRLQRRLAAGNLSVRQRAILEGRVNAVIRRRDQLERDSARRRRTILQQLNSISLEAGFIAPFTRLSGNLFRIGTGFREIGRAAGLGATGIRLAGAAGVVFGTVLKGLQIALNTFSRVISTIASVALPALRAAFRVILGPTLAFLDVIRRVAANLPILSAAFGGLLIRNISQAAKQLQQLTNLFQFAFGSEAQQELKFIRDLASQLGVPLEAIAENYARITAAARDSGIAQEDLRQLFRGTSAAAVALGLDTERVSGLFFAFDQVISKGRLAAEELRRQIGDRLPGAFQIAAKAMGVTTERLDEMLERGQVTSKQFIQVFGRELVERFMGQAIVQSGRITASFGRMRNAILELRFALGQFLEPVLTRIIDKFTSLFQGLAATSSFRRFALFIGSQLATIADEFDRVVAFIGRLFRELSPTIIRFGRLLLTINTVAIGAIIEGFRRLQSTFNVIIFRAESFAQALTGIDIRSLGFDLRTVNAIASAMPLIFDAIRLRLNLAWERIRIFFGQLGEILEGSSNLIVSTIGGAITAVTAGIETAFTTISNESKKAANISRELEELWVQIGVTIQKSLQNSLVGQFELAIDRLKQEADTLLTTTFRNLQLATAAAPSEATVRTRQAIEIAARREGGTVPTFPLNQLTNMERSLNTLGATLMDIRQRMTSVAAEGIKRAVLAVPGGGVSR